MFRRDSVTQETAPVPVEQTPRRTVKVEPKESAVFNRGATFAERKAEADARNAERARRRLVSLGATEFTQRNTRTGEVEFVDATLYADLDHPTNRFVEIDGVPGLHPLNGGDQRRDETTKLPSVRLRRFNQSNALTDVAAQPDSARRV